MANYGEVQTPRASGATDGARPASMVLTWELVEQNGSNKTINYEFRVGNSSQDQVWYWSSRGNCYLNDQLVYNGGVGEIRDYRYSRNKVVHSGQFTTTSNTLKVFIEGRFYSMGSAGYCNAEQTFSLPSSGGGGGGGGGGGNILASSFSLSSDNITIPGNSLTVNISPRSSGVNHLIYLAQNSNDSQFLLKKENVGTSATFTSSQLQNALSGLLQTGESRRFWIEVNTRVGDTIYHEEEKSFTVYRRPNQPPTPADFLFKDKRTTTSGITGDDQVLIQGESDLQVRIPAGSGGSSDYGATIRRHICNVDGTEKINNYSSATTYFEMGKLAKEGKHSIVMTTEDNKGNTANRQKQVMVLPYKPPILVATAERANLSDSSVVLKIAGKYSPIDYAGEERNTIDAVEYRYKLTSLNEWGEWDSRPFTAQSGEFTTGDLALNLAGDKDYDFEVRVTDRLHAITKSLGVTFGTPVFFVGDDGRVAVGGMPEKSKPASEQGALEVHGAIYSKGKKVLVEDDIPSGGASECPYAVGDIYITTSQLYSTAQSVANRWAGTSWEPFGGGRTLVGYDGSQSEFNSVNKTGGAKTVTLSSSQVPRHSHVLAWGAADGQGVVISKTNSGKSVLSIDSWSWGQNSSGGANNSNIYTTSHGGGSSHNNLQPYITTYMWRRIG